jgi:hypothetical protein
MVLQQLVRVAAEGLLMVVALSVLLDLAVLALEVLVEQMAETEEMVLPIPVQAVVVLVVEHQMLVLLALADLAL